MQVVESIKKAREKGVSDDLILQEIRKQNPEKESFFKKAQERGATPQVILNEIIKQNTPSSKEAPPLSSSPSPSSPKPLERPDKHASLEKVRKSQKSGKTVLTKEAQESEEEMRKQFLKRIEAKERGENIDGDSNFFSPYKENNTQGPQETKEEMSESSKPKIPLAVIIVAGLLLFGAFIFLTLTIL